MKRFTRRDVVSRTSALSIVALAGCSDLMHDSPSFTETPDYDRLEQTDVYVSDYVGIRLPHPVERVSEPTNAALVVLHGNPSVGPETVVPWLADGRKIALLGDNAQETWLDWAKSEEYQEEFGGEAGSRAQPAPHLLVAGLVDSLVQTSRFSWGHQPSNHEIVEALDESLGDLATPTPS